MGIVLSLANQKGGVGKTTTAFNLGSALSKLKNRVLLVDNDPQCNLSTYAGYTEESAHANSELVSVDEIYVSRRPPLRISQLFKLNEELSLLPAEPTLAGAEYYVFSRPDKDIVLKTALSQIQDFFDIIIIDNPPALNMLTVNGLMASDAVIVPVSLEFFSLEGIVLLQNTIEKLKEKNPGLHMLGIVPNMFDERRKLNWEVLEALQSQFGKQLFETKIHDSVMIAESAGHGESILTYAPKSRSSKEYLGLAVEIMNHVQNW